MDEEPDALYDNLTPYSSLRSSQDSILTISDMIDDDELKNIEIEYFSDAREHRTVPDSKALLGEVVEMIYNGGPQKFGTQKIIAEAPGVIDRLVAANDNWLPSVFGSARVNLWRNIGKSGSIISFIANLIVTVPVFMAQGKPNSGLAETTRTDLHCEPIANLVMQTEGEKVWTLVEPSQSFYLKPTLAPDGRAYFYSRLDPLDKSALDHVPRYEVKTVAGDTMYVPSWTWHRVEYLPNITAVSVSLFEFNPVEFFKNNCVFAFTLIPNIIKEFAGLKFT